MMVLPGPLLATYTPHPAAANMAVAEVRRLYTELTAIYRRVVQFVMQTLNTNPARAAPAQPHAVTTGINLVTVHSIMGKVPANREETPFWLAQKINTLEAVFPHTGPQDKHRILTMRVIPTLAVGGRQGHRPREHRQQAGGAPTSILTAAV
ncbi:hypothetical protein NDU88_007194 [Pleurodeles waltl]|uniref:Uncharacterized protein n=1 Tax=Pleurodeles waltl TaxID=8319 RepID=A0AAV7PL46_PLEWA|nr:hypothetical protein NDU88_007194 [Pleurodeles waltl]